MEGMIHNMKIGIVGVLQSEPRVPHVMSLRAELWYPSRCWNAGFKAVDTLWTKFRLAYAVDFA